MYHLAAKFGLGQTNSKLGRVSFIQIAIFSVWFEEEASHQRIFTVLKQMEPFYQLSNTAHF